MLLLDTGFAALRLTDVQLGANAPVCEQFPVPAGLTEGKTATRCRISSQTGLSFTGGAADGEVEDHPATISLIEIPTLDTWASWPWPRCWA